MAIHWRAYPLRPEIPWEGCPLEDLFRDTPVNVEQVVRQLKKTAKQHGLPMGNLRYAFNSRFAQEVGLWAESKGKGDIFHKEMYRAYFADGRNIAAKEVLMETVSKSGLDPGEARTVIENRRFRDRVDADWALAARKNIVAAPTFILGNERIVGAKPFSVLENFVLEHGAVRRM